MPLVFTASVPITPARPQCSKYVSHRPVRRSAPARIARLGQGGRMSAEDQKALVRRYLEEVWSRGNIDAIDDILAPNYQLRVLQGTSGHEDRVMHGTAGVKQ